MAVLAPCISIIVAVRTLEERYPGGVERYELACPNQTFCRDEHLTRIGFMGPADVERFVESITATSSLTLLDGGVFVDIAVVDSFFGPTAPCPWLEFGFGDDGDASPGQCRCWLSGTDPGDLAVPRF
jgi:hypothetical protein